MIIIEQSIGIIVLFIINESRQIFGHFIIIFKNNRLILVKSTRSLSALLCRIFVESTPIIIKFTVNLHAGTAHVV